MTDLAQMERKLHGYQVVLWLKQTYLLAEDEEGDDNTAPAYWSKNSVYKAYLEMCHTNDLVAMFTRPVVGKMVKRAFPDVRTKRRGRRGNVKQHYIGLQPVRKKSLGQQLPPTPPAPIQETSRQQVATLVPKAAEEYSWPASVDAANDQCPTPGLSGSGEWHSLAYPVHRTASSFSSPSSSTGAESPFLLRAPYLPSTLQVPTAGRGCVGVTLESLESQWDWGLNSVQVAQPLLEEKGEIRTAEEAPSDLEDSGRLSLAEELAWKRREEGEEDIGSVLTWADQVVDTYPWQLT